MTTCSYETESSPAANEFEFVNVNMGLIGIYAAPRLIERRTELYTEKSNVIHEMILCRRFLTDIFLLAEATRLSGIFCPI